MFYGLGRFYPVLSHAVQKFYRWMSGTKSILFDLASSNKTFAKKGDEIGRREGGGGGGLPGGHWGIWRGRKGHQELVGFHFFPLIDERIWSRLYPYEVNPTWVSFECCSCMFLKVVLKVWSNRWLTFCELFDKYPFTHLCLHHSGWETKTEIQSIFSTM